MVQHVIKLAEDVLDPPHQAVSHVLRSITWIPPTKTSANVCIFLIIGVCELRFHIALHVLLHHFHLIEGLVLG